MVSINAESVRPDVFHHIRAGEQPHTCALYRGVYLINTYNNKKLIEANSEQGGF